MKKAYTVERLLNGGIMKTLIELTKLNTRLRVPLEPGSK